MLDPHGAVGYAALVQYLSVHPGEKGIGVETAHPVQFPEAVEQITGSRIDIPDAVRSVMDQPKKSRLIAAEYDLVKACLLAGN